MPILCPGGSLWRLGKHVRHGGHKPGIRQSSTASRIVDTKGSLAHPFTTKQVDLGPAMSPGSAGGVYMGPEKKAKVSTTATTSTATTATNNNSAQDKKLAEIRSPTEYYTDGNVFIGQDVKDVKAETNHSEEQPHSHQKAKPERTRHDDTLNPDGTLASIVFFEETFMSSKFSHLSTSSPAANPKASKAFDSTSAVGTPLRGRPSTQAGGSKGHRNIIPSWVRQRRCLPTLDEVDFDQIDVISLHSLPTSENRKQAAPERRDVDGDTDDVSFRNYYMNNNWMPSTEDRPVSQSPYKRTNGVLQIPGDSRSALGDLTNKNGSAVSKTNAVTSKSAFYKIPKRTSAGERRSRRNRRSFNNRRQKSSSRESLVNALDKPNDHTYVNLKYIAGIMTESPPRDDSQKQNESVHDYENVWSTSPVKTPNIQRELRYSLESSTRPQGSAFTDSTAKRSKKSVQSRRRSDRVHTSYSRLSAEPDECAGLGDDDIPQAVGTHRSAHNRRSLQIVPSSYMKGIRETFDEDGIPRREGLSSTSSWESAATSQSTEGEECAAILNGEDKNKMAARRSGFMTSRESKEKHVGWVDRPAYNTRSKNEEVMCVDHPKIDEGRDFIPTSPEAKALIDKPSYADNAIRKARIVRTNSIDERQTEHKNVVRYPQTSNSPTSRKEDKTPYFRPKKSSHVETRRSLPAPSTLKDHDKQMTPQRRSHTDVRAVEAKLSQKQNRKIRRTVEGDEVLEALVMQEEKELQPHPEHHLSQDRQGCTDLGRAQPVELSSGRDDASRVQRIIDDWNQCSKRIVDRLGSTYYVGGHVHSKPTCPQTDVGVHQSELKTCQRDHASKPPSGGPGIRWTRGNKKTREEGTAGKQHSQVAQKSLGIFGVDVGQSSTRSIPTTAAAFNNIQNRRSTSSSVIEIYIAAQPYSPAEVDEIEAQEGEILVVNSSMQRENDWMWVYVPRNDRFGYIPAFAARPLEFQYNKV